VLIDGALDSYVELLSFKMGAANWHKKKEEREAAKSKD